MDFSKRSKEVMLHAYNEASRFKSADLAPEHLFLGIVKTDDQTRNLLMDLGIDVNNVITIISKKLIEQQNDKRTKEIVLSKVSDKILKLASLEARLLKHDMIEPYHVLLSILREPFNSIQIEFEKHGLVERIRKEIGHQVESGRLKSKKGLLSRWF